MTPLGLKREDYVLRDLAMEVDEESEEEEDDDEEVIEGVWLTNIILGVWLNNHNNVL